jgi:hypothetical protein
MTGIGVPELMIGSVLCLLLPLVAGYWVIRLAVRHGVMDAQRRHPESTRLDRSGVAPAP